MEVIFVMWGISALLLCLAMCFEYYINKLDESRPLKNGGEAMSSEILPTDYTNSKKLIIFVVW